MPHEASMYFRVIGNVRPAKPEGVIMTGMLLGIDARASCQRKQKCGGYERKDELHFFCLRKIYYFESFIAGVDGLRTTPLSSWPPASEKIVISPMRRGPE